MSSGDVPGRPADPVGARSVDDSADPAGPLAPPRLFTYEEWCALSDDERDSWTERRRQDVEAARRAHMARRRMIDELTVERFGRLS